MKRLLTFLTLALCLVGCFKKQTVIPATEPTVETRVTPPVTRPPQLQLEIPECPVIYFNYDSYEIVNQAPCSMIAEFMIQHPRVRITIVGHTDLNGTKKYNQKLSEKRAEAVADILIKLGASKSRIKTSGIGMSEPISKVMTEEEQWWNRRVVCILTK